MAWVFRTQLNDDAIHLIRYHTFRTYSNNKLLSSFHYNEDHNDGLPFKVNACMISITHAYDTVLSKNNITNDTRQIIRQWIQFYYHFFSTNSLTDIIVKYISDTYL